MSDTDSASLKSENDELRRSLTRISYVGMGLSPQLDAALNQLRKAIKDDETAPQIHAKVERISNLLRELEEPQESRGADVDGEELVNELLAQPLPARLKTQLRQFAEPMDTIQDVARAMATAIDNYVANLQPVTQSETHSAPSTATGTTPGTAPAQQVGWLTRLWQRWFATPEESQPQTESADSTEPEINDELRATLLNLAQQMERMDTRAAVAKELLDRIEQLQSHQDLVQLMEFIAAAFCQFMGDEQRQFEQFLQQIAARIEYINTFINATVEHEARSHKAQQNLEGEIKEQVVDIHQSLADSHSLDAVKQAVASKVDTIVERVNLFVENQSKYRKAYHGKVKSLRKQLQQTQKESEQLRQALQQQRIKAQTDPLTGLANRYAYNERIEQELTRWQRYQNPLSFALVDIDHFKQINDTYGHDIGDEVLKQVASILQSRMRDSDFVARFGGEEFVILMPETELVVAIKVMNKLRQSICARPLLAQGQQIVVSASFGVTEFAASDGKDSVFARADKALYRAKDKGRNQVCAQRSSNH